MRISKKTYYGLRAVTALAIHGELSVRELALGEGMPEDYLHKILQTLKRQGIVSSEKGANGGYTLAKPSTLISVWDIVQALDGGFRTFPTPRLSSTSPYPKLTHCQTNQVWKTLEEKIHTTLSKMSIQHLITPPNIQVRKRKM